MLVWSPSRTENSALLFFYFSTSLFCMFASYPLMHKHLSRKPDPFHSSKPISFPGPPSPLPYPLSPTPLPSPLSPIPYPLSPLPSPLSPIPSPLSPLPSPLSPLSSLLSLLPSPPVVARYKDKMHIKLTVITGYHGSQGSHM